MTSYHPRPPSRSFSCGLSLYGPEDHGGRGGQPEERMMSDKFKTWSITIDMHEESGSK